MASQIKRNAWILAVQAFSSVANIAKTTPLKTLLKRLHTSKPFYSGQYIKALDCIPLPEISFMMHANFLKETA